jgi:hypothetical protein
VPPPLTVEFEVTPDVAARAAAAFVRVRGRALARDFRKAIAWLGLYAGFCAAALAFARLTRADAWVVLVITVFAAVCGGLVLLVVGLYALAWFGLRAAGRRFHREAGDDYTAAPDPTVRWVFTADGFETTLRDRTRGVPWAGVRSFVATPEFWIVGVKDGPDLLLPRDAVPAGVEALLREKLGEPVSASAG